MKTKIERRCPVDLKKAKSAPLNADLAEAENIMAHARSAHGPTGGSVAEQVIRFVRYPVVVVRNEKPEYRARAFPFGSRGLTKRTRVSL